MLQFTYRSIKYGLMLYSTQPSRSLVGEGTTNILLESLKSREIQATFKIPKSVPKDQSIKRRNFKKFHLLHPHAFNRGGKLNAMPLQRTSIIHRQNDKCEIIITTQRGLHCWIHSSHVAPRPLQEYKWIGKFNWIDKLSCYCHRWRQSSNSQIWNLSITYCVNKAN